MDFLLIHKILFDILIEILMYLYLLHHNNFLLIDFEIRVKFCTYEVDFDQYFTLTLFEMYIDKNYVDEFIMKKAGGVFIEKHDRPHYHIQLNEEAGGHVVIGKVVSDGVLVLSAFRIPYVSALYMQANVIHNDCFLTGLYGVVYSKTENV